MSLILRATSMIDLKQFEVWFVTGSQDLYGDETLKKVAEHSQIIARALSDSAEMPVKVVFKPVLTTPEAITESAGGQHAGTASA